jgi:hypothetical protein
MCVAHLEGTPSSHYLILLMPSDLLLCMQVVANGQMRRRRSLVLGPAVVDNRLGLTRRRRSSGDWCMERSTNKLGGEREGMESCAASILFQAPGAAKILYQCCCVL